MKRRRFLANGLALPLAAMMARAEASDTLLTAYRSARPEKTAMEDDAFLEELQFRGYQYFLDAAHPTTGFIADRGAADGSWFSDYASSAACGFALAAYSVAATRGWSTREAAAKRARDLLTSLVNLAGHERGFVYHFFEREDGRRRAPSEVSSIDTALLVAGAMTAAVAFSDDAKIGELAGQLYRRIDWTWMLSSDNLLHMGWTPENGLLPHRWDSFSELSILVLLAIGAPENAIDPSCWLAWKREPVLRFEGENYLSYPPLFVHQYPQAFFDFRGLRSPCGYNLWDNSVIAHRAQIAFMTELANRFPNRFGHYGPNMWGLTSSDSISGYRDWGGPYQSNVFVPDRGIDGTLVPSAAAGGLSILPTPSLQTLKFQRAQFGDRIFGRYGFCNAYNPATQWFDSEVICIDTGISLLAAENLRSGGVWQFFMSHPAAQRSLKLTNFKGASQRG